MANPEWVKGKSGNPSGRPKSQFGAYIRESTQDGKELADRVLKLFRESKEDKIVLDSAEWLANRGWGKPVPLIDREDGVGIVIIY